VTGPARRFGRTRRHARTLAIAAVIAVVLITADASGVTGAHAVAGRPAAATTASATTAAALARLPLTGKVVGIDPGHNGRNYADPDYIGRPVWNGREWEDCDTTGTQTDGGYTEALFNFRVAGYLRADLVRDGARVVLTRTGNNGVGPCVNTRSYLINEEHANVAVDIHADGFYPSSGRGFAILEPVADGPNDTVIAASARLGADIRAAMLAGTAMPVSNYDGRNGINQRDDLAGLNLTRVPKILIEVGNMKNAADTRMLTSAKFQQQVAKALLAAIITFLK
jgi:N-acetylmuramoyl-L-alanine amidase